MVNSSRDAWVAVFRHTFRMLRLRALLWGLAFALVIVSSILGYVSAFPTQNDRLMLTLQFVNNRGLQAMFGAARNVDTVSGFTAWRVGGLFVPIASVWGFLTTVRLMRGEEEDGRLEQVVSAMLGMRNVLMATFAGFVCACCVIFLLVFSACVGIGTTAYGFSVSGSLWLALLCVLPALVFGSCGMLLSQLATTRRLAASLSAVLFGFAFLARVCADSSEQFLWLRWVTPLGWTQEVHPFKEPQPVFLLFLVFFSAAMVFAACVLCQRRDYGLGFIARRTDRMKPRLWLLGGTTAHAFRSEISRFLAWGIGAGAAGLLFGAIAKSVALATEKSSGLAKVAKNFGGVNIASPTGYLSVAFLVIAVAVSLYGAGKVTHLWEEERLGRLDLLLSTPVFRWRWLCGHIVVTIVGILITCFSAGIAGWFGAAITGSGIPLTKMVECSLNLVPISLLFFGLGICALALKAIYASAIAYGTVTISFLLEMVGASVSAPAWLLNLSPFHHLAFVPAEPFAWGSSLWMIGVALLAGLMSVFAFAKRDVG